MKTRTLWAALLAGEPGIVFGVSLLGFVVVLVVVLVFCQVTPRRAEVSDAAHPTVWQLQRKNPRSKEEWLRQRVEAYRNEIRARAAEMRPAEVTRQDAAELRDRDAKPVALVTEDDWPTQEDLCAAEAAADVWSTSELSSTATQQYAREPIARPVSSRNPVHVLAQREPRSLFYGQRKIAA